MRSLTSKEPGTGITCSVLVCHFVLVLHDCMWEAGSTVKASCRQLPKTTKNKNKECKEEEVV